MGEGVDDDAPGPPLRGVVEVEWDGWDDDGRRSRAGWIVAIVLLVATLAVAGLVVWAAGSDAELPPERPAEATSGR
jgi:hypothetical protein